MPYSKLAPLAYSDLTYDADQAHPFLLGKRATRTKDDDEGVSPTNDRPLISLTLRASKRATHTNDNDDTVSPEGGGNGELDAAISLIRRCVVRADDDVDDVSPTSDGDRQLNAPSVLRRKLAVRTDDDDDDMSPARGSDGQLDAAIDLICKRPARVENDDDDVCPTSSGDDQLDAALVFLRRRAARTIDDDDDVSPTSDDDSQLVYLSIRANPASRGASIIPEDDNDVAPTCGGDEQLAVSPSVLAKRAAGALDDDDDVSPTSGGDGEIMAAPVRRGRGNKSGSVAQDLDDSMGENYSKNEARLQQAQAKLQEAEERLKQADLKLMLCEADEGSLGVLLSESTESSRRKGTQATGAAAEALRAERLLRARQHLGAEQARRQMASVVARARLETATASLAEADTETIAATQAEKEAADASADAWAQVHLARVRKSKVRQRAEAEALAAQQCKEEKARLAQARAIMEEAQAHLQHMSIELKVCESDERVLDKLLSTGTTESERMESERTSPPGGGGDGKLMSPRASRVSHASPLVRRGCGSKAGSAAADVDDEISLSVDDTGAGIQSFGRGGVKEGSHRTASMEAMRSERLARARGRLGAERVRREVALAQTERQREAASAAAKARLDAATAQLVEAEAEEAKAAQEEKETADACASAWSQVHMERVRSFPRGTAAQRAEMETRAARERAQEEARLQLARSKLKGARERLRQTEKELTLCKTEETALREAEERALRALDGSDPAPSCQQGASSVTSAEIVVEPGSSRGEIDSYDEPGPEVDQVLRLEMEARSRLEAKEAKEAKREERLQRARGRLGAERARREKAEAEVNARVKAKARGGASDLGWSPVALRSPTEIVSGLGPVQQRHSPIPPRSNPKSTSPPPMMRTDAGVWSPEEAQVASPETAISTPPLALAAQRPTLKPRSKLSLKGQTGGSRRRVAVVPSLVSCTHETPDRQGPSGRTVIIPNSALAAQRWLSNAVELVSSRRESAVKEDDANQTTLVARV